MTPRFIASSLALCIAAAVSGWLYAPAGTLWLTLCLGALLVALALIDLRTYRLPDPLTLSVFLLGAIMVTLTRPEAWMHHLIGASIGYLVLVAIELAFKHLRGRDGLGRGDAKLLGALGMWTGWMGLAPTLLVASMLGLLAALAFGRRIDGATMIAFGPWIALGGWVVWLFGRQMGFAPY